MFQKYESADRRGEPSLIFRKVDTGFSRWNAEMSPLVVLPKGVPGGASVKPQRASSMYHNILQLVVFTIFINGLRRGLYCST
jgi:hypothetical protein